MEKENLHLWFAYPDDLLQQDVAQACAQLLSQDEHARWQGFKFEKHRREYLATHVLARIALSSGGALLPQAWRFRLNAYGKPAVEPDCGLQFNLSNSQGLVVCAVARGAEVGVDVEPHSRAESILEVAQRVFSPLEVDQLEALKLNDKPGRALRLWTLKEAYIKARGVGLALPLAKISFCFNQEESIRMVLDPVLDDDPQRWQFCLLEHAGHCVALVVESRSMPALAFTEARPILSPPTRIALEQPAWFPRSSKSL